MSEKVQLSSDLIIGENEPVTLMVGPCAVESYEQVYMVAKEMARLGLRILRGGAFKPRTSSYSFQGLGEEGLKILRSVADEFGLLVVTEALGVEHVPIVAKYADIIQVGSRNMQHFPLLWAVGKAEKPVLLKRGFMNTVKEWLFAAEHIAYHGNRRILLCERGIRTFENICRFTLDINGLISAKQEGLWPVIGDPSHATGNVEKVLPAARAIVAAGADGLLIEVHPDPRNALSDGQQSWPLERLSELVDSVRRIALAVGRDIQ